MPFIHRNEAGKITAVSYEEQDRNDGYWEWIDGDSTDLAHFATLLQQQNPLSESDLDFVRVVEDLVEVLIEKNFIHFTDLPVKAQQKLSKRKSLRGKLNKQLDLLDDESEGFL
ncbi:hypothetical protein TDB9533_04556 [Thalassocella blandensis]|nr:hypothetical protein TDB9533_04556 [Thalassocella blandensis]